MFWLGAVLGGNFHAFPAHAQLKEHMETPNNRTADKPDANPSPQNVLILQGRKDPKLEIWFSATYSTTNPECETQSVVGKLYGAPPSPQTLYEAIRVPSGQSEFSVRVYLDRYLLGKCNWQPISILHLVKDPDLGNRASHKGLVVIRQNGKRKTSLSYTCQKSIAHSKENNNRIVCKLAQGVSLEMTEMSPQGGVVDLEYTLAQDGH
jgi:hypothetical protein